MTDLRESEPRLAPEREPAAANLEGAVQGSAIVYRLFDVGYEILLDRVLELLAPSSPERPGPTRVEAQAIQIKNPPVQVSLGYDDLRIADAGYRAEMFARVFDFGVVSLRLRIDPPLGITWRDFSRFGSLVSVAGLAPVFDRHLESFLQRIRPAVVRPVLARVTEDYVVFRVDRLPSPGGEDAATTGIADEEIVPLLLNERRPLSDDARRELLPHRFSYYPDDLAILTWNNALVVEPAADDTDIQYVLEFANAQLLELRVYDALLDDELPNIYDRVSALRAKTGVLKPRYARMLADLQTLVADSTELVERAENALKVTDDVYLARVYSAAMEIFRGREWRKGIDRKLQIIRETYEMLNAESQAFRAEVLELAIVILIVAEIVLSLVRQ
ncbi:MAG TPA: hypothetical protein VEY91_09820 [Candidatus Limnocylindria bacterium]|nr:hypothetical protein [Candidatus Limnocylindria bacterium]